MAERGLNISDVSRATGISRNAISALYHNTGKGIQFDTLDKLCDFLKVTPNELILYMPFKYDIQMNEYEMPILEKQGDQTIYDGGKLLYEGNIRLWYKGREINGTYKIDVSLSYFEKLNNVDIRITYSDEINECLSEIPRLFTSAIEEEIVSHILSDLESGDFDYDPETTWVNVL